MSIKETFVCDACNKEKRIKTTFGMPEKWIQCTPYDDEDSANLHFCSWRCLVNWVGLHKGLETK